MKYVITVRRGWLDPRLEEWPDTCRDIELLGGRIKVAPPWGRADTPEEAWRIYAIREKLRREPRRTAKQMGWRPA